MVLTAVERSEDEDEEGGDEDDGVQVPGGRSKGDGADGAFEASKAARGEVMQDEEVVDEDSANCTVLTFIEFGVIVVLIVPADVADAAGDADKTEGVADARIDVFGARLLAVAAGEDVEGADAKTVGPAGPGAPAPAPPDRRPLSGGRCP